MPPSAEILLFEIKIETTLTPLIHIYSLPKHQKSDSPASSTVPVCVRGINYVRLSIPEKIFNLFCDEIPNVLPCFYV